MLDLILNVGYISDYISHGWSFIISSVHFYNRGLRITFNHDMEN